MTVVAVCNGCPWPHPLAYRDPVEEEVAGTVCPFCSSTSYTTRVQDLGDLVERYNRLHRQLLDVEGVGQATAGGLTRRLVACEDPGRLQLDQLRAVPGVGVKNGAAILEVLRA